MAPVSLLERADEVTSLRSVLTAAADGRGSVVRVEGPAGIGKSRLMQAAADEARSRGFVVLGAVASELERDAPFAVVRQLLELYVDRLPPADRRRVLAGAAALAAPIVDPRADPLAGVGEEGFLHGLYWVAANLADRQPLVLVIDDAQWADAASIRFLAYLARRMGGLAIALVLARRRPAAERPADPALDALGAAAGDSVLRPAALSVAAVAEIVQELLEREPGPVFARTCHAVTGGNPFLLVELLRSIEEKAIAPVDASAELVRVLAPATVADSVGARLARLGDDATALARALAVLGMPAEAWDAGALAGLSMERTAAAADLLAGAGILGSRGLLAFVHPLVRQAVYESSPPRGRAGLHAAAATLLARDGRADQAAAHLLVCDPRRDPEVAGRLVAAADRARGRGAAGAAVHFLRRALAELPGDVDLLLRLGIAETETRDPAGVDHLLLALERAGGQEARVAISLALGRALAVLDRVTDAVQVMERGREVVADPASELAMQLEAALLSVTHIDLAARPVLRPRRLRGVRSLEGDTPARRALLCVLAHEAVLSAQPARQVADLAERAWSGGRLLHDVGPADPLLALAGLAFGYGARLDAACEHLSAAIRRAQALGSMTGYAALLWARAEMELRRGDLLAAESDARSALDIGRGMPWETLSCLAAGALVAVLVERDEPGAAEGELEAAGPVVASPSAAGTYLRFRRGVLHAEEGRAAAALPDLLEWGRQARGWDVAHHGLVPWAAYAAPALAAAGRRAEALALCREALGRARRIGDPWLLGLTLTMAARAEGHGAELARLGDAERTLAGTAARLEHARALVELGAALRRHGERTRAQDVLRRGLDAAHACAAKRLGRRARDELHVLGARPRRERLSGSEALTASERRVAALAADGLTNRQVAQALFITSKTVEMHLGRTYRKLGIRHRSELAGALGSD